MTVVNATDGFTYRMCTQFPNAAGEILTKEITRGTGRKPTAKNGIPVVCP